MLALRSCPHLVALSSPRVGLALLDLLHWCDLKAKTAGDLLWDDLSLNGMARSHRHSNKLTNLALRHGKIIQKVLVQDREVVLDRLALRSLSLRRDTVSGVLVMT